MQKKSEQSLCTHVLSPAMVYGAPCRACVLNRTALSGSFLKSPGFFVAKFVCNLIGKGRLLWIGM